MIMLSSDPSVVRAQLRHIAEVFDPASVPSPAVRAALPEVPAGDPPVFTLGQAEAEAERAFAAGYAAEHTRQTTHTPAGGSDAGVTLSGLDDPAALGMESPEDPGPGLRQAPDYRS